MVGAPPASQSLVGRRRGYDSNDNQRLSISASGNRRWRRRAKGAPAPCAWGYAGQLTIFVSTTTRTHAIGTARKAVSLAAKRKCE